MSFCLVVGSYITPTRRLLPLAEIWHGTTWELLPTAPLATDLGQLAGISCTAPTSCVAVGGYRTFANAALTLAERWDGTSWHLLAMRSVGAAQLASVACRSAARCTAVGFYRRSSGIQPRAPLAEAWNGTAWRAQPTPAPGTLGAGLYGVSCGATAACMAVGGFLTAGPGGPHAFAEVWNGTRWRLLAVPTRSPVFSDLYAVSCVHAAACMAAGESFPPFTLAERWNGASWQRVQTLNP